MTNNHQFEEKYCLNALQLKTSGNDVDRIGNALITSKIKLTPHQIDAALFAFRSPLYNGVLLADEVGLGKTIEAGIIISQLWSEGKRNILIVSPASIMRQWNAELYDKFHLDSFIMDRKMLNQLKRSGCSNPFANQKSIVIVSYQMCSNCKELIINADLDIAIIDEAHKLRNVHNPKSIISNNINYALSGCKKILLTATPIQNNLMDLYGLASLIDDRFFGDKDVFRYNYIRNYDENKEDLERRLEQLLHRTLRKQVEQYVKFTNRIPYTFKFAQTEEEQRLYSEIISLLQDESGSKYIIPNSQRHLLLLILCKLMGSSAVSVRSTMEAILKRLQKLQLANNQIALVESVIVEGYEDYFDEDLSDEFYEEVDQEELSKEISRVENIINLSNQILVESKYVALKDALEFSFSKLYELGANKKVIIFTESRKTQDYLKESLTNDGYSGVITYNGSNSDEDSNTILKEWLEKDENIEKKHNSRAVNVRTAILDKFEKEGTILIATEAGAEGLNLQFCSLVINYDLPWNPQRVEQRIGRCHRFGQKHDVVVINFINSDNLVENRVYELLDQKFHLFQEVFGSSDEVLGKLNDGKEIENAIVNIYLSCRTDDEINKAFDDLQDKYKDEIETSLETTKSELFDHFDEDVQRLFEDVLDSAIYNVSQKEQLLWRLTKCILDGEATFNEDNMTFCYGNPPRIYNFLFRNSENTGMIDYSVCTELGMQVIAEAKKAREEYGTIAFDISNYNKKIQAIENKIGKKGFLSVNKLSISSFEEEEHLVFNGIWDDGDRMDDEFMHKLMRLEMHESYGDDVPEEIIKKLQDDTEVHVNAILLESQEKNNKILNDEVERINRWADDKIQSVQLQVENMRAQRKLLQKESDQATNLADKERIEREIQKLTKRIRENWILLAEAEEDVEASRQKLINNLRMENMKKWKCDHLFSVAFEIR